MAEKKIVWNYNGGVLTLETPTGIIQTFDLTRLTEKGVEHTSQYGTKQILADSVAGFEGTDREKVDAMMEKFEALCRDEFRSERVGGTVSKASFMESCKEQGISEEVAEKLWTASQAKTKEAKKAKKS